MYVITATIRTRPGAADEFEQLLAGVVQALSHAPCFIMFSIHRAAEEPDQFLLYERWTDAESYGQLRNGPIFAAYLARRAALVMSVDRGDWSLTHDVPKAA